MMPLPFPRPIPLRAGCAAAALLLAAPAMAQIEAQEVRDEFQSLYEGMGMTIAIGSEEASEDAVTLADVVLSFEFTQGGTEDDTPAFPTEDDPERTIRVEAAFPEIAFEETPEGAVRATVSPQARMTVTATDAQTGEADVSDLSLAADGFALVVSETGGEEGTGRRYAMGADRLAVELEEATRAGEAVDARFVLALAGLETTTVLPEWPGEGEEPMRYTQSGRLGSATIDLDVPGREEDADPEAGPGRLVGSLEVRDMTLAGEGDLPGSDVMEAFAEIEDPTPLFEAGLRGELEVTTGPSSFEATVTGGADPSQAVALAGEGEGGSFAMDVGADGLGLATRNEGFRYRVEGGGMPFPRLEVTLDEADSSFRFPVLIGEGQPFDLRYLISGLAVNEEVWALFDPEGRLPRDPATLLVAVEGSLSMLANIFDEEQAPGEPPQVEVEEATLALRLDAVGAAVAADGDFTFDASDQSTFPGMPAPTGTIRFEAAGIDALLDTLSEMGLVPSDQLMPARMMLGLFARTDGAGGYTSDIEVDGATGAVTANGQRLR